MEKYKRIIAALSVAMLTIIYTFINANMNYSDVKKWGANAVRWIVATYGQEYYLSIKSDINACNELEYEYAKAHPEDNPYNYGNDAATVDKYFKESGRSKILSIYKGGASSSTTSAPSATANTAAPQPSVEKHKHSYTEKLTTSPTCTEKGEKTFTCTCGDKYTEEVDALGHSFGEPVVIDATCTTDGLSTTTCEVCGEEVVDTIKALGHDFNTTPTIAAASCLTDGLTTYTCSRCDESKKEVIPAYGHTTSEWIVDKPNGVFTKGIRHKECMDCHEIIESEEILSRYPIWYLYCGVGIVVLLIVGVFMVSRIRGNNK